MAGLMEKLFGSKKKQDIANNDIIVDSLKKQEMSSRDIAIENLRKQAESARIAQAPAIQKAQAEAARKSAEINKFKEQIAIMSPEQKAQVLREIISKQDENK